MPKYIHKQPTSFAIQPAFSRFVSKIRSQPTKINCLRKHEAGKSTVIEAVAINADGQKKDNEWPNVCPVTSLSKLSDLRVYF